MDETQERLEMVGVELDDMCRRLGMGESFQVRHVLFIIRAVRCTVSYVMP